MENQLQNQLSLVETLALNRVDERLSGSRSALARQPQLAPTRYEIVTRWEERIGNNVRRTIISKQLTVSSVPDGNDCLVTLEMTPPEIRPVDLTTLEEVVVRLSTLYQRLLLRVSATGQLLALLNHAEIVHTWATIKQELASSCLMVAQVCTISAWCFSPPDKPTAPDKTYGQVFPHFFADTNLSFQVQLAAAEPTALGNPVLTLTGQLTEPPTDRAAVAQQIALAVALDDEPGPPPAPDGLAFACHVTYELQAATGWPATIEATVNCRSEAAGYSKEYDLTIQQL
ncbi:MAG: hypothetical protein EOO63_13315 [Hymenobacter sp.]|nr:MAG: hypothetical protein EOO63_13315 [Hymenobacter sp.]